MTYGQFSFVYFYLRDELKMSAIDIRKSLGLSTNASLSNAVKSGESRPDSTISPRLLSALKSFLESRQLTIVDSEYSSLRDSGYAPKLLSKSVSTVKGESRRILGIEMSYKGKDSISPRTVKRIANVKEELTKAVSNFIPVSNSVDLSNYVPKLPNSRLNVVLDVRTDDDGNISSVSFISSAKLLE